MVLEFAFVMRLRTQQLCASGLTDMRGPERQTLRDKHVPYLQSGHCGRVAALFAHSNKAFMWTKKMRMWNAGSANVQQDC
jgi:hypothetical protein